MKTNDNKSSFDKNNEVEAVYSDDMISLDLCFGNSNSEHYRMDDPGEPCDDGRSGGRV
jgi:hypothetical protein